MISKDQIIRLIDFGFVCIWPLSNASLSVVDTKMLFFVNYLPNSIYVGTLNWFFFQGHRGIKVGMGFRKGISSVMFVTNGENEYQGSFLI